VVTDVHCPEGAFVGYCSVQGLALGIRKGADALFQGAAA